ncbi:MAG: TRAM domain-containing protein [Candidatus Marsarchaeota archaeon]|nr:TRAM domain-containing protein [Candidatus Marsarchaeota archaeon]MCL5101798.1 TRAM domain-containing protein [Candidatus Marsarchaeota archaeon]
MEEDEGFERNDERGEERRPRHEGRDRGVSIKPSYFLEKPVKAGDEVDVTIEAVASKGDGIAKVNGFVVFVKGAKQGETMKVRITDVKARFALAEKL